MASARLRSVAALTALALVMALAPATALAAPRDRATKARTARKAGLATGSLGTLGLEGPVESVTPDARDSADDTPAGATDLTSRVSGADPANGFGRPTYDLASVFATATNESAPGAGDYEADIDWYRIDVSELDVAMGKPLTIEAKSGHEYVDPVIEVYGPALADALAAPAPHELVDESGLGWADPDAYAGNDNGPWWELAGSYSAGLTFIPLEAGSYFVRVRPNFEAADAVFNEPAGYNYSTGAGPYTLRVKAGVFTRLAGASRVQTAISMSRECYADGELAWSGGTVILANGWNYPDALAGSTLAGAAWAPLLLTHQGYLDADVKAEIQRLGAVRVFILGSEEAVSASVANSLLGVNGMTSADIVRVAGAGRVQTAIEIARTADEDYGIETLAFVANGWSFPDALSASPMAAWNVAPLLLTHKDYLDKDTLDAIAELGVTDVVVLGSTAAVGPAVETALKNKLGATHVKRIGGGDRYDTSRKFAEWATGGFADEVVSVGADGTAEENKLDSLDWTMFGVAAGFNYPDALGGGAFAGNARHPLLLTPAGAGITPRILDVQETLPAGNSYLSLDAAAPNYVGRVGRGYVFGAASVVDNGVLLTLDSFATMPGFE